MISEGHREGLGLTQICQDTPPVAGQKECRAQGEPEVDGLLTDVARLRQMPEGTQGLFEVPDGLAVGRARQGFLPRLAAVTQGFVPDLMRQGVLEGVGLVGEEARLVEKLGRLEVRQAAMQRGFGGRVPSACGYCF